MNHTKYLQPFDGVGTVKGDQKPQNAPGNTHFCKGSQVEQQAVERGAARRQGTQQLTGWRAGKTAATTTTALKHNHTHTHKL